MVEEEARERMYNDDIEGGGLRCSRLHHALELGPAVVCGGRACFDIGLDDLVTPRRAMGFALTALVWNRDIMLGLPCRRNAQIKGGAQRHGHGKVLLRSSARSEKLIEEVAEPGLENIHLGLRNRHAFRPVVGDRPG
jgi:hypothetical protein